MSIASKVCMAQTQNHEIDTLVVTALESVMQPLELAIRVADPGQSTEATQFWQDFYTYMTQNPEDPLVKYVRSKSRDGVVPTADEIMASVFPAEKELIDKLCSAQTQA